jgi:hypothetical protein
MELVRAWAREIVSGRLHPAEGAQRISGQAAHVDAAAALAEFGDLAARWEASGDDADGRAECERRMVEEAGLLLADTA